MPGPDGSPPTPPAPTPPVTGPTGGTNEFISGHAALIVLVIYGGLVAYALFLTWTATDAVWVRTIYLLNGIEAIAFAAAGFLFGREVHRGAAQASEKRAESAEQRADSVEERAHTLDQEAEKGKTLAKMLMKPRTVTAESVTSKDDLQVLRRFAEELYPQLTK